MKLASGKTVDAWTYNGQVPGPQLRVTEGDLVEIKLQNELPGKAPVTIHWHGVDVPNGEDGMAGATQGAALPGKSGIVYSPNGNGELQADLSGPEFDPYSYGSPKKTELHPDSDFDRDYKLVFDEWLGFAGTASSAWSCTSRTTTSPRRTRSAAPSATHPSKEFWCAGHRQPGRKDPIRHPLPCGAVGQIPVLPADVLIDAAGLQRERLTVLALSGEDRPGTVRLALHSSLEAAVVGRREEVSGATRLRACAIGVRAEFAVRSDS